MSFIEGKARRELAREVDSIQNGFMSETICREAMGWPTVRLTRSGSGASSGSADQWTSPAQRSAPYPSPTAAGRSVSCSSGSSQRAWSAHQVAEA